MKVTTQPAAHEGFQPVTISMTFQSLEELAVFTQLFGGTGSSTIDPALRNGIRRTTLEHGKAIDLAVRLTFQVFNNLNHAYEKAKSE